MLPVELHRFLRCLLPVVLIALLDVFHQGLQLSHRLDLPALLYSQRHERKADQQCKCDYGYSKIQEGPGIQKHQPIDHGLDDDEIPSIYYNV